ncbi:GNAT family N-acetyltransferase [Caulobacter sp. CCUG 60055]|uniref:GNAT family N-acetyltransferase n=1 Tax=Caulobacter sp. CCUG 60055 TaxID=2100090 RepID=UPI001FA70B05|nr:GNAT family N-acetyltransferase [Caulobacter sp. CCUG 60055]
MNNEMIRPAVEADVPTLRTLIDASVMALQAGDYTEAQRRGALGTVFGIDTQLIADGTYFVVETEGRIVGCGGWSRRKTLFGSDHVTGKDDALLDPDVDPAKIRAFFVHPDWARRGIGSRIMRACEDAAAEAGFRRLELGATLTGVPLYERHGFTPIERIEAPLPNGEALPVVRMGKALD